MITVTDVEVGDTDTVIIGPEETDKEKDRYFGVVNGDNEIEITARGLSDSGEWEERDTKTFGPNEAGVLIVGPTVWIVKLTGKTTSPGQTSTVDAVLFW